MSTRSSDSGLDVLRGSRPSCGHAAAGHDTPSLPELLRVPHLAEALGLTDNGVRDLLARGEIPAAKVGRQWVVRRDALLAHLEDAERQRQPTSTPEAVLARHRRGRTRRDLGRQAQAAR